MSLTICPRLPLPLPRCRCVVASAILLFLIHSLSFHVAKGHNGPRARSADVITHGGSCHMLPENALQLWEGFKGSFKLASM